MKFAEDEEITESDLKANLIILYDLYEDYSLKDKIKLAYPKEAEINSLNVDCHWIETLPRYTQAEILETFDDILLDDEKEKQQNN